MIMLWKGDLLVSLECQKDIVMLELCLDESSRLDVVAKRCTQWSKDIVLVNCLQYAERHDQVQTSLQRCQ